MAETRISIKIDKKFAQLDLQPHPTPSVDRLTALPDTILIDILSRIPTKTAISTSVLSTPWHYLWTQLNNLRLDYRQFPQHTADFYPVIDQLFTRLTSPLIHTFWLHVPYPRQHQFELWLRQLCTRSVENIYITVEGPRYGIYAGTDSPFTLPLSIFQTQSLKCLILPATCLNYELPNNTDIDLKLPNLIKLELSLRASQCSFVAKLISSCPLLADLTLTAAKPWNNGGDDDGALIEISSDNLNNLRLYLHCAVETTKVIIDAPELKWFFLFATHLAPCSLVRKPVALRVAHIYIVNNAPILSLLPLIVNVRYLYIYSESFGVLESFKDNEGNSNISTFHKLENLTLHLRRGISPFHSTSPSLLLHIKTIQVVMVDLTQSKNLKKLAEFLLCNAPRLETLTFHLNPTIDQPDEEVKNKMQEMLFCIDLYSCAKNSSKCSGLHTKNEKNSPACLIKYKGQHVGLPSNDVELQKMEKHVELLRKFLSLRDIISDFLRCLPFRGLPTDIFC